VHRIGRTGRAGATGMALGFCASEERPFLRSIERLIGASVPVVQDNPFQASFHKLDTERQQPQQQRPRPRPGQHNRQGQPRGDQQPRPAHAEHTARPARAEHTRHARPEHAAGRPAHADERQASSRRRGR
jgi:ATP-dependent RNA helicase RhlE